MASLTNSPVAMIYAQYCAYLRQAEQYLQLEPGSLHKLDLQDFSDAWRRMDPQDQERLGRNLRDGFRAAVAQTAREAAKILDEIRRGVAPREVQGIVDDFLAPLPRSD